MKGDEIVRAFDIHSDDTVTLKHSQRRHRGSQAFTVTTP